MVAEKGPIEHADFSGIKADRSDRDVYRRRSAQAPPAPAASISLATGLLLLLSLVLGGALFHTMRQGEIRRAAIEHRFAQEIQGLQEKLAEFAGDLDSTDASLTEAGSETDKQIRFLDGEIRKLWAVSNQRNKNIQKNTRKKH